MKNSNVKFNFINFIIVFPLMVFLLIIGGFSITSQKRTINTVNFIYGTNFESSSNIKELVKNVGELKYYARLAATEKYQEALPENSKKILDLLEQNEQALQDYQSFITSMDEYALYQTLDESLTLYHDTIKKGVYLAQNGDFEGADNLYLSKGISDNTIVSECLSNIEEFYLHYAQYEMDYLFNQHCSNMVTLIVLLVIGCLYGLAASIITALQKN